MTEIEAKALALVREVLAERDLSDKRAVRREVSPYTEALCRAIEAHEAFKQEVSDKVEKVIEGCAVTSWGAAMLDPLIIPAPKPDPLVEAIEKCAAQMHLTSEDAANALRAALDAAGFEIRERGDDQPNSN
jgi:hypothetical protein